MSETERRWGGRIGFAGHLARAVVFGLIGLFVTNAAVEYDPKESIGLDGALQKLVNTDYGPYLLGHLAAHGRAAGWRIQQPVSPCGEAGVERHACSVRESVNSSTISRCPLDSAHWRPVMP
jgi:hypothetical protein